VSLSVTAGLDFFGGGSLTAEERVSSPYFIFKKSSGLNQTKKEI
jgi:hypothetical protein